MGMGAWPADSPDQLYGAATILRSNALRGLSDARHSQRADPPGRQSRDLSREKRLPHGDQALTSPALSRKATSLPRAALTLVESRLPADPFLLTHFEKFYREVVAFKSGLVADTPGVPSFVQPEDIREHLRAILLAQEEQVSHISTLLGFEMYRQAQRVMACMADDIFSGVAWPAKT